MKPKTSNPSTSIFILIVACCLLFGGCANKRQRQLEMEIEKLDVVEGLYGSKWYFDKQNCLIYHSAVEGKYISKFKIKGRIVLKNQKTENSEIDDWVLRCEKKETKCMTFWCSTCDDSMNNIKISSYGGIVSFVSLRPLCRRMT